VTTKSPGESGLLLIDVVAVLTEARVSYAVIGAMAAAVHGVVRASVDADVILAADLPHLRRLAQQFANAGLETQLREGDAADPISAVLALKDTYDNRVDLLAGLRGLEPAAFSRAITVTFQETALRVIGLEDFIAMKLFAGSPIDRLDARTAIQVAGAALDRLLLRRLAERYGPATRQALDAMLTELP